MRRGQSPVKPEFFQIGVRASDIKFLTEYPYFRNNRNMSYFPVHNITFRTVRSVLSAALALVIITGNAILHLSHNHLASSCHGVCSYEHTSHKAGFASATAKTHVEAGNCVSCFIVNHRFTSTAQSSPLIAVSAFSAPYALRAVHKHYSSLIHNPSLRAPPFSSFYL